MSLPHQPSLEVMGFDAHKGVNFFIKILNAVEDIELNIRNINHVPNFNIMLTIGKELFFRF